ncbi:MAG: hypothetical protein DSZ09_05255 [Sulfurovum sp.]|nr:MAG: hypothetical protein DSZ09_05255 [Sulfurovum sp.]
MYILILKGTSMSKVTKIFAIASMIASLMILGFTGCTSTKDINVEQATSKKVDMKGYKTYAPLLAGGMLIDSKGTWVPRNMDLDAEIQYMTKKELDKRGKKQVLTNPDFYVTYVVGVDMDTVEEKVSKKDQVTLSNIPSAALALIFIDAQTNEVIWMAEADGELKQNLSDKKVKQRLDRTIKKMFRGLR